MKKINTLLFLLLSLSVFAQTDKQIVVEHFTNTKCTSCSGRNPGLYNNINTQGDVLHIAYHPSRPYASCEINQTNVDGNDDRTKHYGIYGGTPRIVINGEVIGATSNYAAATLFDDYKAQTSPFELSIKQDKSHADSIQIQVMVKALSTHSFFTYDLYVALAEDTIFYDAPNGEDEHYDVFRKAASNAEGNRETAPYMSGDSVIYDFMVSKESFWDVDRMFAYAILQDTSNQELIQAGMSSLQSSAIISSTNDLVKTGIVIHPNPTNGQVNITGFSRSTNVEVFDIRGTLIKSYSNQQYAASFDLSDQAEGLYLIRFKNSEVVETYKVLINR